MRGGVAGRVETGEQRAASNAGDGPGPHHREDQEYHGIYRTGYCNLIIFYTAAATT